MHKRRQIETKQGLRTQPGDPERPLAEDVFADHAGVEDAWQQERICPNEDAGGHSGNGAGGRAAPPNKPTEKGRRQLRDGSKRQQPDRGKLRGAG